MREPAAISRELLLLGAAPKELHTVGTRLLVVRTARRNHSWNGLPAVQLDLLLLFQGHLDEPRLETGVTD